MKSKHGNEYYFSKERNLLCHLSSDYMTDIGGINRRELKLAFLKNCKNEGEVKRLKKRELDASFVKRLLENSKHITFEVTRQCNLSCVYCINKSSSNSHVEKTDLPVDYAEIFLDYMKKLWNKYPAMERVIEFYGGEPLLNISAIKKIVEKAEKLSKSYGFNFKYSLITNGILLSKHIEYLIKKDFFIYISLDGDQEANAYRVNKNGRGSYSDVIRGTDSIYYKNRQYFVDRVNFQAVLHKKNSLEGIRDFFIKKYDKVPVFSELSKYNTTEVGAKKIDELFIDCNNNFFCKSNKVMIDDYKQRLPVSRKTGLLAHNMEAIIERSCKKNAESTPTGTCDPFAKKIFVTSDGKILPCETIDRSHYLGEIKSGRVLIDCDLIAEIYNRRCNMYLNLCRKCARDGRCNSCAFLLDGNECSNFMTHENYGKKIIEDISDIEDNAEIYKYILRKLDKSKL